MLKLKSSEIIARSLVPQVLRGQRPALVIRGCVCLRTHSEGDSQGDLMRAEIYRYQRQVALFDRLKFMRSREHRINPASPAVNRRAVQHAVDMISARNQDSSDKKIKRVVS